MATPINPVYLVIGLGAAAALVWTAMAPKASGGLPPGSPPALPEGLFVMKNGQRNWAPSQQPKLGTVLSTLKAVPFVGDGGATVERVWTLVQQFDHAQGQNALELVRAIQKLKNGDVVTATTNLYDASGEKLIGHTLAADVAKLDTSQSDNGVSFAILPNL